MREAWPGVCHDTIICIVTGGRPGRWGVCHDTIGCIVTGGGLAARLCREIGHNTAVQALLYGSRHGATQRYNARHGPRQGVELRYKLVS